FERGMAGPEALHDAGPEIFDDDIGGLDEPLDERTRFRPLQIEDGALLAGVELAEGTAGAVAQGRARAHHVAAVRRFELDDLRATIGEQPRAMRPGDRRREIDDPRSFQRAVHA